MKSELLEETLENEMEMKSLFLIRCCDFLMTYFPVADIGKLCLEDSALLTQLAFLGEY